MIAKFTWMKQALSKMHRAMDDDVRACDGVPPLAFVLDAP